MQPVIVKTKSIHAPVWLAALLFLATACGAPQPAPGPTPVPQGPGDLLLPARALPAGDNDLEFQRLSLEQGLSQSVVTSVLRDDLGFMWFSTQDGLNRYDGYEFVVYKHDPGDANSLSGNFVWSLLQDPDGSLWIGTNGSGLDRLDPRSGRFDHYRHDPADPTSLAHDVVRVLFYDRQGNLWVGTAGGGLDRFDPQNGQFIHYHDKGEDTGGADHSSVEAIYQDRAGYLWVGTNGGGLDRLDPETGTWQHYHHDPVDLNSLAYDSIHAVAEDADGALWVGTEGHGLDRFDPEAGTWRHYRHDPADPASLAFDDVGALIVDRAGTLWIGTNGGGLDRFDPKRDVFVHQRHDPADPTSLSCDQVWSFYEDADGALWAGTFGGGVNRLDGQGAKFALYRADATDANSLSSDQVWSVYQDADGTLWVGTSGGGLNRLDPQTGLWRHYRHNPDKPASLADDTVWSILRDRAGRLWLGTSNGLDRLDEASGTFVHYSLPPAFVIYQADDGLLWFGTWGGGLGWADPDVLAALDEPAKDEGVTFYHHDEGDPASLGGDAVTSLHQDRDGALWIGTFGSGLDRLDLQSGQFTHYRHDLDDPASLSSDSVLSIHQDRSGALWVATVGGGLNRFDAETGTFTHYFEKDGLANDTVYGILEDDLPPEEGGPSLWLSTNGGLSRLNLERGTFRNYDVGDGLQSNEFNQGAYFRGPTGQIFVGGVNGLSAFHPAQVKDNPAIPPVVLTALTQGGEAVEAGVAVEYLEAVTLRWPHNFFEFEVAALGYAQPAKSRYAYMLEGFDEDWIESGTRRFGRYTNLPGGTYTLRVKGANGDGVWNEVGRALTVEVVPPLWANRWFQAGLGLLLLGAALGAYRLRVNGIRAAAAIENARLYEDARVRLAQLTALQETSRAVASTLELDELLALIIDQATTLLQGDGGLVNLVDWNVREDGVVAASGSAASLIGRRSALDDSLSGWVTLHNEPIITNRVQTDGRTYPPALDWLKGKGIQCVVLAPLAVKERVLGTLAVMGRQGGHREFVQADLDLLVAFANQAATAIENAQLLDAERRRADELEALRTTLADVTAELELPSLLQAIVERSASLLGATGGEFGLYDEASQELRIAVSYNLGRDYVGTRHKLGEGIMGRVAQTGESIIIPDYRTWPGGLEAYEHVRGTLAVPLKVGSRLVGVFTTVTTDPERKFTPADLHLLDLFAQQAAIAIENARLYGQAQQLAIIEERQRLARDLHDSVTQALYGMTLYSEAAAQELALGQLDLVTEYLGELQDTAREAMAEMRLLIHELRPSILTEEGLVAALEARLQTVEGRSGLKTDFQVEMQGRLPLDVEEGLYRVAQEALNNALKHARASTVRISLQHAVQEGLAILKIADDGVGFDPSAARREGGLGLSAMEERVAELGGRFSIGNGSGKGTRVQVEVPV